MATEYSLEQDLQEAEAMAKALEDYLQEDNLYGSVGGGLFSLRQMPSLTIGALRMRLRRLQALRIHLNDKQRERLAKAQTLHDEAQREWPVHYEQKLLHEANSRLDAMEHYFREVAQSMESAALNYRPEQLRRTIVEEVLMVMAELNIASEDIHKKVRAVDHRLQSLTQQTDFLWDAELESVYPMKEFWWLYRQPRNLHG